MYVCICMYIHTTTTTPTTNQTYPFNKQNMAHIYTDEQTNRYLDELKEKNPDFNLSKFVKQALKEFSGFEENIDISKIEHDIVQAKHDLEKAKDKMAFLENQKIKFLANQKVQVDRKEQEISETTARIIKYCDISEKEAEELAEDYFHNHPHKSITKFLDEKGVKMKL